MEAAYLESIDGQIWKYLADEKCFALWEERFNESESHLSYTECNKIRKDVGVCFDNSSDFQGLQL